MAPDRMVAARAAALFASDLSSRCHPSRAAVAAAIRTAIATHGGVRGCFGEVAAAYGERPETAVPRMRWARQTIEATYAPAAAGNQSADELLASAISGDRAAWHEIISKHRRLVVNMALRVGLSRNDAEDVAQLTWLRLWEHGHQIRQPERLSGWLLSTARREAVKLAASSNRHVLCADLSGDGSRSRDAAIVDTYPAEQEYDWPIQHALSRLPARYRTLLQLLSSELEPSYSEVAGKMGLPVGSIGPMRMRAIRMLEKTPEYISGLISEDRRAA